MIDLISKAVGFERQRGILTPLYRHGKVTGALVVDSPELSEYFIPSVRTLGQHISAALGIADEHAKRKKLEDEIRKSEERFKGIFESANDAMIHLDTLGKILNVNRRALELFGGSKEELLGKHFSEVGVVSPNDMPRLVNAFAKSLAGEKVTGDVRIKNRKGQEIFLECLGTVMKVNGEIVGSLIIARDITDRERMEEEIRRQADLLQRTFNTLTDAVFVLDSKSPPTIIECNESACNIFGYKKEEMIGETTAFLHVSDETLKGFQSLLFPAAEKGLLPFHLPAFRMKRKDGSIFPSEHSVTQLLNDEGKRIGWVSVVRDITERKKMEENLIHERDLMQALMDNMPDAIYFKDTNSRFTRVNRRVAEWFGLSDPKDAVGKTDFDFYTQELASKFYADEQAIIQSGQPVIAKEEPESHFGMKWVSSTKVPIKDSEGRVTGIVGISRDITERKIAEQALRESEEKYRNVFEYSPIGIGIATLDGTVIEMNRAMEVITGYSKEDFEEVKLIDTYLDPEQREKLLETIRRYGRAVDFSARLKRKDSIPYDALLDVIQIYIGGENLLQTMCQDITEQKRTEEEMKRRLMKFRLEDGNLYLVKESAPALSLEAFNDLLKVGYHGFIISRTPEEEFKKVVEGNFKYSRLAERGGEKSVPPEPNKIEVLTENLPKKSAVLFERLDYFVSKKGFKEALFLVQRLRDLAYLGGNIFILSIDPATLNNRELRLLEKETNEVEPRFIARLAEDLLEILRFVYKQNNLGTKPSYSEVRRELHISKPTAGKRIKRLTAAGYVTDSVRGSRKVLELTQKGRDLFSGKSA